MSSYLSFYIVPKRKSQEEQKKHIILTAYSRNTTIYQYFYEGISPVFIGSGGESQYTTLTVGKLASVIQDFDNDIKDSKDRLVEYEKYAGKNPEYINEIIELKKYIQDLQYWKDKVSFIVDIVDDIDCYEEIEEVCCNID